MKKSLIVLTAALSFGFAAAQTETAASAPQVPALTDVPAGHWAKDAIDRLVGRGIILGYPDGTYRGTQNLTRYEAAVIIARLLDQMQTGAVPATSFNPEELTALQNAIQELAADLTALGVRVSDLEENAVSRDDFSRLEERVEELAATSGEQEAIEGLTTQITEITTRVDELGGNYDTLRADVDDNATQITALNDLTVLLNQDIIDIQDRVSAVETAQEDFVKRAELDEYVTRVDFDNITSQLSDSIDETNTRLDETDDRVTTVEGRVTGVEGRVTAIENAPKFGVTAGFASSFGYLSLVSGTTDFDVSRLLTPLGDGDFTTVDTAAPSATGASSVGSLTFGITASNLATANGSVVVRNGGINFSTATVAGVSKPVVVVDSAYANGTISGQNFSVDYNTTERKFKFSDYLLNNAGDPLVGPSFYGTLEATQLPLQPKITVVTGTTTSPVASNIVYNNATPAVGSAVATDYAGIRAEIKPNADSRLGVSYATSRGNRYAVGTDYSLKLGGFITVTGEGVLSVPVSTATNVVLPNGLSNAFRDGDKAFYTNVIANLGIADVGVNFRTIDPAFGIQNDAAALTQGTPRNAGLSRNGGPYAADQVGFGAAFGAKVSLLALGAYGDTYTAYAGGTRTTAFGAKAGVVLGALELVGFYNQVSRSNNEVIVRDVDAGGRNAGMGIANVPRPYSNTVGASLKHNGTAPNALVRNLNFTVENAYFYRERTNDFQAYADYTATVGGLTLNPLVRFHSVTNSDANLAVLGDEGTTFKVGAKLSSAPLAGVPLQPSFFVNGVYRTTNPASAAVDTTEVLAQGGLTLNQFLAPNTTAQVGYSYYQGLNVATSSGAGLGAATGTGGTPFSAASDNVASNPGAESGRVQGVYAQLGYNGLTANYGVFRYTNLTPGTPTNGQTSVGQGFKVAYTFKF